MGEHTELFMVVDVLGGTHLAVTAGSARATAAPAHSWRHPYGVVAVSGLGKHTAGRPW